MKLANRESQRAYVEKRAPRRNAAGPGEVVLEVQVRWRLHSVWVGPAVDVFGVLFPIV